MTKKVVAFTVIFFFSFFSQAKSERVKCKNKKLALAPEKEREKLSDFPLNKNIDVILKVVNNLIKGNEVQLVYRHFTPLPFDKKNEPIIKRVLRKKESKYENYLEEFGIQAEVNLKRMSFDPQSVLIIEVVPCGQFKITRT